MDGSHLPPLRSLPRFFSASASGSDAFEIPPDELDKIRKVLRLPNGSMLAALPGDGRAIICKLEGRMAIPLKVWRPKSEAALRLTIVQALPKGDKIDEIVRACTELGAAKFILFPSDRTIVKWEESKRESRLHRLATIAMEACEVSFRVTLPQLIWKNSLAEAMKAAGENVFVLSESEEAIKPLPKAPQGEAALVIGPEGGWSPREIELTKDKAVTLGPRVLRVDHAAAAAAAIWLLSHE